MYPVYGDIHEKKPRELLENLVVCVLTSRQSAAKPLFTAEGSTTIESISYEKYIGE